MESKKTPKVGKLYLYTILLLMFLFPVVSMATESFMHDTPVTVALAGKWFIFWAIGMRLFTAGLRQVLKPAFTAVEIFHLEGKEAEVIVKELGFANVCLGLVAIVSICVPSWRTAAAFAGGLYMGIAGFYHIMKKPASPNEVLAMVSDIFIFLIATIYLWNYFG